MFDVPIFTMLNTWMDANGESDYGVQRLVIFDRMWRRSVLFIDAYPNEQTARSLYPSFLPTSDVSVLRANSTAATLWKGAVSNIDDAAIRAHGDIDPTAKEYQGRLECSRHIDG
jgi:hypothetical protein